jgi:hypothetical protein
MNLLNKGIVDTLASVGRERRRRSVAVNALDKPTNALTVRVTWLSEDLLTRSADCDAYFCRLLFALREATPPRGRRPSRDEAALLM